LGKGTKLVLTGGSCRMANGELDKAQRTSERDG